MDESAKSRDDLIRAIGMQNDCINDLRAEIERLRPRSSATGMP